MLNFVALGLRPNFAIFVIAAFLTPPDAVSQSLMALPMYALYEAGLLMSRALVPAKPADTEGDPA